jgi:hypothetical protein
MRSRHLHRHGDRSAGNSASESTGWGPLTITSCFVAGSAL